MTETETPQPAAANQPGLDWRPFMRLFPLYRAAERRHLAWREANAGLQESQREVVDQKRQIRALEKVVRELMDRRGALPLPPPELRLHVGRVSDMANFLGQGLDSARRVLEVFGPDPGGPVLDWGCGTGRTLSWLRDVGTWDVNYRGCDVDADAIAWLQSQQVTGVAVCGDMPPLPHESGSLAGIFCFSVLTHIPPQRHADWYAEIHRVLRPGARAYITVHGDENIRTGKTFIDEERQAYADTGWSWSERPGHYKHAATVSRAFTVAAVGSGFEIEAYDELGYHSMDSIRLRRL